MAWRDSLRSNHFYCEIELQNVANANKHIDSVCIGKDNGISISKFYGQ